MSSINGTWQGRERRHTPDRPSQAVSEKVSHSADNQCQIAIKVTNGGGSGTLQNLGVSQHTCFGFAAVMMAKMM
jgi:hypothetical protein